MSNRRSIFLLFVVCAALTAANVMLRYRDGGVKAGGRTTLLNPEWKVESIRIERVGNPATVLKRDGSEWRIAEPYAASVDERPVLRLLDMLAFVPISEGYSDAEMLRRGNTRQDYIRETPVAKLVVSGDFGEMAVSFGKPTPAGDEVYAAVDGAGSVVTVPSGMLAAVDLPADGFRRRSLFLAGPEAVASFDVKRGANSMLTFTRSGETWKVGEVGASSQKVAKFLSDLAAASAESFVWPVGSSNEADLVSASLLAGYGLDPESAVTVTLKGAVGEGRQVSFGKSADAGHVYALVQNGSAVVTVPAALRDAAAQDAVMFTDSRLFPVEPRTVAFFSLTDGETVYALARGEQERWRIESPIAAPADTEVVETMLARILALSPADVDAGGIGVALSTNSAALKVSRQSVLDGGFERLRSREMLRIDPKDVRRIVRTAGGADAKPTSVVYVRDRRAWNVESAGKEGATVLPEGVDAVLAAINPLTAERVEKLKVPASELDGYGLGAPYLTVAVDQDREDAVRRNILVGGRTVGGRFATVGSADAVFVVSDAVVEALSAPLVGGN